jgi:hypothetical protein
MTVRLVGLEDCREDFSEAPAARYSADFHLPLWAPGENPQIEGPSFSGIPPFPFDADPV